MPFAPFSFTMKVNMGFGLVILLGTALLFKDARAQEAISESKSVALGWVLGLDPIPGDALAYAGKSAKGDVKLAIGGIGAAAVGGLLYLADYYFCSEPAETFKSPYTCSGNWLAVTGISVVGIGAGMYLGSLIWDGIGGIRGVYKHNDQVQKSQASIWTSFQPTFAVTNEGLFAGAALKF